MSGPSHGAKKSATKILRGARDTLGLVLTPHVHEVLCDRIAEELQDKFDLGHKSAGGAQCDKVPAMGGLLEIALDQEEIDALCTAIENDDRRPLSKPLAGFLEKISFHRSSR